MALFIGDALPTLGGRFITQVPVVLLLLSAPRTVTPISNRYAAPDKGDCGVKLIVNVKVFPEPEMLLVPQFKFRKPFVSVAPFPGLQAPLAPTKVNLFVAGL